MTATITEISPFETLPTEADELKRLLRSASMARVMCNSAAMQLSCVDFSENPAANARTAAMILRSVETHIDRVLASSVLADVSLP